MVRDDFSATVAPNVVVLILAPFPHFYLALRENGRMNEVNEMSGNHEFDSDGCRTLRGLGWQR